MKSYELKWQNYHLKLGFPPLIMGILNVTPDSFSDGGQFFDPEHAINHAQQMVQHGADIIDIGGESTRPFADPVPIDLEIQRVVPVISALSKTISVPISIDTSKAHVAEAAIESGASIINDISALRDPKMASVAKQADIPIILMHMQGTPQTMQVAPQYENIIAEILHELKYSIEKAVNAGIKKEMIIADPGIGFGKTVGDNFQIIQHLSSFQSLDVPLLIGSSRKSFIRKTLEKHLPDFVENSLDAIECGTQATVTVSALNGAHIIRVHNVYQTQITLTLLRAIQND
ncbi:Dihydropteroate synthase [Candidatus Magnetomorum sp. HK-1]|nr:Dihydropteroate synthase [Candidatus Magnetomorum sp. HK-1]